MTNAACRSGNKARAWSSLPMILSLQEGRRGNRQESLLEAAAIQRHLADLEKQSTPHPQLRALPQGPTSCRNG